MFLLALSCSTSNVNDSGRGGLDMVILGVCSELGCLFSEDPLLKNKLHIMNHERKIIFRRTHIETYRLFGVTSSASKNSSLDSVSLDAEASADMIFL